MRCSWSNLPPSPRGQNLVKIKVAFVPWVSILIVSWNWGCAFNYNIEVSKGICLKLLFRICESSYLSKNCPCQHTFCSRSVCRLDCTVYSVHTYQITERINATKCRIYAKLQTSPFKISNVKCREFFNWKCYMLATATYYPTDTKSFPIFKKF